MKWSSLLKTHWVLLGVGVFLAGAISIIPLRLTIAERQAPQPQAILMLGGGQNREEFTAQFANAHPSLEIWVSTGSYPAKVRDIFRSAKVPEQRLILDYRAVDTVTNFTTLVKDFQQRDIHHVYLITSDFHMRRAKVIATIVLGSRGIAFTPVAIPTHHPSEPWYAVLRDLLRAMIWLLTGRTGASLNPDLLN